MTSRAVKTLENVTLILASKFESFRELPLKNSRDRYCPHSRFKFREFSRIFRESSNCSRTSFLRAVGIGGALKLTPYLFSGLWNQGGLENAPIPISFFLLVFVSPQYFQQGKKAFAHSAARCLKDSS